MANGCETYPIALALEDIIPILLGGTGLYFLAERAGISNRVTRIPSIAAAAAITLIATLAGPTRKILITSGQACADVEFLHWGLFPVLAAGFSVFAWALLSALRERVVTPWPFFAIFALAGIAGIAMQATKPLLWVSAVLGLATGAFALLIAKREGDTLSVWLFGIYMLGTAMLPPLASRIDARDTAGQWAEQGTNTLVQAACLVASYRLLSAARARQANRSSVEALS